MRTTRLKVTDVEAKLKEFYGNMAAVGRALGVACSTIKRFIDKRPELLEVATDLREEMKDNAESALYSAVLAGQWWAIRFFLLTQAKDRGYTLRSQVQYGGAGQRVVQEVVETVVHTREEAKAALSDMAEVA